MTLDTDRSVGTLKGVGDTLLVKLHRLGIFSIGDLLQHFPRRYEDFSQVTTIHNMRPGLLTIRGSIERIATRKAHSRKLNITEAVLTDGTGTLKAVWFNQPYLVKSFPVGSTVFVSGKLEFRNNDMALQSPAIEMADHINKNTGRIVPVYPETEGLTSKQIRGLILPLVPELSELPETLPDTIVTSNKLMPLHQAIAEVHFPTSMKAVERARYRIAFEELFYLMLTSAVIKAEIKTEEAPKIPFKQEVARGFVEQLGFELTNAQRLAAWQILQDMQLDHPMNRLLEGDVGSGKTVVAALAAVMAMSDGFQVALMVPTEILARQHAEKLAELLAHFGFTIELVLGGETPAKKRAIKERIAASGPCLVLGTHALLTGDMTFNNLGLVIIDEQHRFGVAQRQALKEKGHHLPHLLSMTATPIPRSLMLTVYGEMDLSVIDTLPPGRQPVTTKVVKPSRREATYAAIEEQLEQGRQAFVVCPLISESDTLGAKSVTEEADRLAHSIFKHRRIGTLHGKMTSAVKQEIMKEFAAGKLDILVTTSVIEVGIDVPNATIMMIEGAERFGLAALHQLRGRVGRGKHQSYCYLMADGNTPERLSALERTNDGFRLAQIDLELRGPGQIYGRMQHGILDLRMADIVDTKLVTQVKKAVTQFVRAPDTMLQYAYAADRINRLKAVTSLD